MTLHEAIQIGLDNSEVVRVISLGAQGIPVGGFEPTPLNTAAGGAPWVRAPCPRSTTRRSRRPRSPRRCRPSTPTSRPVALGPQQPPRSTTRFQAGVFSRVSVPDRLQPGHAPSSRRRPEADGDRGLARRCSTTSTSSTRTARPTSTRRPTRPTPSSRIRQPLLGGNPQVSNQQAIQPLTGLPGSQLSGLEANRAPIVIARLNADASVWRFKAEVMAHVRSIEQQYWASPSSRSSSGAARRPSSSARRS